MTSPQYLESAQSPTSESWRSSSPYTNYSGLEATHQNHNGADAPEVAAGGEARIVPVAFPAGSHGAPYKPHEPYHEGVLSTQHQENYEEKIPASQRRICGLKRSTFWFVLGGAIAVIVIAVLGGVLGGVLSSRNNTNKDSAAQSSTSTATSMSTAAPISTTSSISTSSTATSTTSSAGPNQTFATDSGPGGVAIQCPQADGYTYTNTATSKVFKRQCNRNYVGGDVINMTAMTMEACMDMCANRGDCIAVNWMYRETQGTGSNYCWIKNLLQNNITDQDCESAVLQA